MLYIQTIFMISLSCSFLRIQAFHYPLSRHISSSLVSMRSKKKHTNEFSFQDDLLVNKRNKKGRSVLNANAN